MNRRLWIVAATSAALGIVIGCLAAFAFASRIGLSPSSGSAELSDRQAVFGEGGFDGSELLRRAMPKDARDTGAAGGRSQVTRYGYDGCSTAEWEGATDPEAVKEFVFKALEARFDARKWITSRGGGGSAGSPEEHFTWYELRYHSPDDSAGGWVRLFIHQQGRRVAVVLVYNTSRDWLR
jgi:hypothetical protein